MRSAEAAPPAVASRAPGCDPPAAEGGALEFPVYIHLGDLQIHPHPVFEGLAYLVGFQVYLWLRRRRGDPIAKRERLWVVVAAICGAAVGSKILFWLMDPAETLDHITDPYHLMGGKTIVGALLGGVITVELTKKLLGVSRKTGDLFALPLVIGTVVGRIGCFLTGLADHTHGTATSLPWGVDFGDGVARHPTQLYEIVALILIGVWVVRKTRQPHSEGDVFLGYLLLYLAWRFGIEFWKPEPAYLGLSSIQWACLAAWVVYAPRIRSVFGRP